MSKIIFDSPPLKQNASQRLFETIVVLLLFACMYIMNSLFPIYLDDWSYSRMMDGSEIGNILDIVRNQYNHYFTWGGRSIVHTFAQILLYLGRPWSDILNTSAYIAFIWIIYRLVTLRGRRNALYIPIIHCFIWFLTPSLGECIFWKTGSANYLWGTLIIISFLYIYCAYYLNENRHKKYFSAITLLGGLQAGWTNENMAIALIFFLVAIMICLRIEKRIIPKWMIFGLIGTLIGTAFMLAAPGNFIRYSQSDMTEGEPIYSYLFYRTLSTIKQFSWYCLWPTIIYIITFFIYIKIGEKKDKKVLTRLSLVLFCTAMIATIAMIAAPIFPERVWFAIITLILIATMLLFTNLGLTSKKIRILTASISAILIVFFAISFHRGYQHLQMVDQIWEERTKEVMERKVENTGNIILYGKYKANTQALSLPKVSDIPLDSVEWIGRAYGTYLGVKSVSTVEGEKKN